MFAISCALATLHEGRARRGIWVFFCRRLFPNWILSGMVPVRKSAREIRSRYDRPSVPWHRWRRHQVPGPPAQCRRPVAGRGNRRAVEHPPRSRSGLELASHSLPRSARPGRTARERSQADPCRHGSRRRRADLRGRAPPVACPSLRILRDRDGRPYRLARRLQRRRRGDPDRRHRLVRLWRHERRLPLCRRLGLRDFGRGQRRRHRARIAAPLHLGP